MACFARHRVFFGCKLCSTTFACCWFPVEFRNVNKWIITYHALVHAVESQQSVLWIPINTSADAKFVTVNTLSIDNVATSVGC